MKDSTYANVAQEVSLSIKPTTINLINTNLLSKKKLEPNG